VSVFSLLNKFYWIFCLFFTFEKLDKTNKTWIKIYQLFEKLDQSFFNFIEVFQKRIKLCKVLLNFYWFCQVFQKRLEWPLGEGQTIIIPPFLSTSEMRGDFEVIFRRMANQVYIHFLYLVVPGWTCVFVLVPLPYAPKLHFIDFNTFHAFSLSGHRRLSAFPYPPKVHFIHFIRFHAFSLSGLRRLSTFPYPPKVHFIHFNPFIRFLAFSSSPP
jgi:hypothetical protein